MTCVSQQTANLCPISSCPLSTLHSADIETLVEDISSNLLSPSNSASAEPVISDTTNYLPVENGVSEITIHNCPVCDKQFDLQTILENHLFEHSICLREDENIGLNSDRSTGEDIDESLECKQCALTFTSQASFIIHKKMRKILFYSQLATHKHIISISVHGLNRVFRCLNESCSQLFENPIDYILHAQVHSQKLISPHRLRRINRCKICKKTFQTSAQLEYHMNYEKHTFFCQLCSAEFESSNAYHNHLAKHTKLTLYHCTMCTKAFQKRADLSRHVISEHKNDISNTKTCSICKLTFTTRSHLKRHNATKHSDIKPFQCKYNDCQQAFAR